jgi:hypothetical protein
MSDDLPEPPEGGERQAAPPADETPKPRRRRPRHSSHKLDGLATVPVPAWLRGPTLVIDNSEAVDPPRQPEDGYQPAASGLLQGLPRPLVGPVRAGFLSVTDYLLAEVDRTAWPLSFAERGLIDRAAMGTLKITLFRRGSFTGERFEVPAEAVASCAAELLSGVATDLHQTGGTDTWDVFVAACDTEQPDRRVVGAAKPEAALESAAPAEPKASWMVPGKLDKMPRWVRRDDVLAEACRRLKEVDKPNKSNWADVVAKMAAEAGIRGAASSVTRVLPKIKELNERLAEHRRS